jgi:hypothetical protein
MVQDQRYTEWYEKMKETDFYHEMYQGNPVVFNNSLQDSMNFAQCSVGYEEDANVKFGSSTELTLDYSLNFCASSN